MSIQKIRYNFLLQNFTSKTISYRKQPLNGADNCRITLVVPIIKKGKCLFFRVSFKDVNNSLNVFEIIERGSNNY